jgi:hypothetical protein
VGTPSVSIATAIANRTPLRLCDRSWQTWTMKDKLSAEDAKTAQAKAPSHRREAAKHRTHCGIRGPSACKKLDCGKPSNPQGCNTSLSVKQAATHASLCKYIVRCCKQMSDNASGAVISIRLQFWRSTLSCLSMPLDSELERNILPNVILAAKPSCLLKHLP